MRRILKATHKTGEIKALHTIVFAVAMMSISLQNSIARANDIAAPRIETRIKSSVLDLRPQLMFAMEKRPPRRLQIKVPKPFTRTTLNWGNCHDDQI